MKFGSFDLDLDPMNVTLKLGKVTEKTEADPGFIVERGRQPSRGHQHTDLSNFSKNCMKLKLTIRGMRAGCSLP